MKNVKWLIATLFLISICIPSFAQVEHGLLVGAGVGFPLQDGWKETTWGDKSNLEYHEQVLRQVIAERTVWCENGIVKDRREAQAL